MNHLIEDNLEQLKRMCQHFKVKKLELFGSALVKDEFDSKQSDIDFLVEFQPLEPGQHADAYFGFLNALEELFERRVDLIETRAIKNPYFLEVINQARKVLYAA